MTDISVIIDSEGGRIDPSAWQKDIGTPFPASITELVVHSIKSPMFEEELLLNTVCNNSVDSIKNDYVEVGIHRAENSAEYSSVSVSANILQLELRGTVKIKARDKKYKFSLWVV